jgi:hypothetical protein
MIKEIEVKGITLRIFKIENDDLISLSDMIKAKNGD